MYWQPGITTDDIDQAVHQMIIDNGAYPSPLGYGGFPKSVCTSVNECICHGIPDSRVLEVFRNKEAKFFSLMLNYHILENGKSLINFGTVRMVILSILM